MERRGFLEKIILGTGGFISMGNAECDEGVEIRAYSANYSKTDLDGNGILEGKELEGEGKKKFGVEERVSFGANVFGAKVGNILKFKLYNGKGNLILESEHEIKRKKDFAIYTYEPGQLKEGRYKGIWSAEGKKDVKCEVEVENR